MLMTISSNLTTLVYALSKYSVGHQTYYYYTLILGH